jgi:hypothetical protein
MSENLCRESSLLLKDKSGTFAASKEWWFNFLHNLGTGCDFLPIKNQ